MTRACRERVDGAPRDAGMTLIEVLVAMTIFGLLSSLLLGFALATSRASEDTKGVATVGEEARLGMERFTRELRQASAVTHVTPPGVDGHLNEFTVSIYDGTDCPDVPDELTYTWDPATHRLLMKATGEDTPLLATKVTSFELALNSSSWQYDANGDGTTTWQELDASSIGDHVPGNFDSAELRHIDMVGIRITTTMGSHEVHYETNVDLRNQDPDGPDGEETLTCAP